MDLLVLAGVCILFSGTGIILLIKNRRTIKSSIKTSGEIVDVWDYRSTSNQRMYSSKIEFKTAKNERVIITNPSSSNIKPKIGSPVSIYYNEQEPSKAKIGGWFTMFGIPSILLAFGAFSLFLLMMVMKGQ